MDEYPMRLGLPYWYLHGRYARRRWSRDRRPVPSVDSDFYKRVHAAYFDWLNKMLTPLRMMWEPSQHQFYSGWDWRALDDLLFQVGLRWAGPLNPDRVNFWILASGFVHSSERVPFQHDAWRAWAEAHGRT